MTTDHLTELRSAARRLREQARSDLATAVAELLDTAANRLEAHPDATGGMTQASLKIARAVPRQGEPLWHPDECLAQGHEPSDHIDPSEVGPAEAGR